MKKRSVVISGHSTSITMEDAFWEELKDIATARGLSLNKLVSEIDDQRRDVWRGQNLSSALRLYILQTLKQKISE